jgi:hypothetical protein
MTKKTNKRTLEMTAEDRAMYSAWAKAVLQRDDYTCQVCLKYGGKIYPHHIKTWAKHVDLRFRVDNGIALCGDCHSLTFFREGEFEDIFFTIIEVKYDANPPILPKPERMEPPTERKCSKCGAVKSISEFAVHPNTRWGYTHVCLICKRKGVRECLARNPGQTKRDVAAWYLRNKEYRRMWNAVYNMKKTLDSSNIPQKTKNRIRLGLIDEVGNINYGLIDSFLAKRERPA